MASATAPHEAFLPRRSLDPRFVRIFTEMLPPERQLAAAHPSPRELALWCVRRADDFKQELGEGCQNMLRQLSGFRTLGQVSDNLTNRTRQDRTEPNRIARQRWILDTSCFVTRQSQRTNKNGGHLLPLHPQAIRRDLALTRATAQTGQEQKTGRNKGNFTRPGTPARRSSPSGPSSPRFGAI